MPESKSRIRSSNITLPAREREWVEDEANRTDRSPNSVTASAVRIYQLWLLGHLVESDEYKSMRKIAK